jgi:hypothetical protein
MTPSLRIAVLVIGLLFTSYVFSLLIRRKLTEKNSIIWLIWTLVVLIFSFFPPLLNILSTLLGVDYPPTLLFLCTIFILLIILLHNSIQISNLTNQVRELTQQYAVKELIDTKNKEK